MAASNNGPVTPNTPPGQRIFPRWRVNYTTNTPSTGGYLVAPSVFGDLDTKSYGCPKCGYGTDIETRYARVYAQPLWRRLLWWKRYSYVEILRKHCGHCGAKWTTPTKDAKGNILEDLKEG